MCFILMCLFVMRLKGVTPQIPFNHELLTIQHPFLSLSDVIGIAVTEYQLFSALKKKRGKNGKNFNVLDNHTVSVVQQGTFIY